MQSEWPVPSKNVKRLLWRPGREPDPEMEVVRRKTLGGILENQTDRPNEKREHVRLMMWRGIRYNDAYKHNKGILLSEVKDEIASRAKKQEAVRFLDLGPGRGEGLKIAEEVAPNVYASGFGLGYPEEDSHRQKGVLIRRPFESTVVKMKGSKEGYYDVIQSDYGLFNAINTAAALENALNSLRYGGKLFNYQPLDYYYETKKFLLLISKQGFLVEREFTNKGKLMEIITRKPGATADFRKHYADALPINRVPIKPVPPTSLLERARLFFRGIGEKLKPTETKSVRNFPKRQDEKGFTQQD